jgi:two-component system, NarL family, response regulator DegU
MPNEIRLVVADDHPVFRRGLAMMIAADARFRVVAEAANGQEALQHLQSLAPDLAILDVNMPGLSGLEVAREAQRLQLPTRIIFLTMHRDEVLFNAALDVGARGYLLKESAIEEIIACLRAVAANENFVSPPLATYLFNRHNRAAALKQQIPTINELTPAERRVLRLIAEHKTTREIAAALFISPRTVERHRENICAKLELHGSNALIKFALEHKQELF